MPVSEAFHTPNDIANRFGVKATKIIAWINSGELLAINAATRMGGKPRWKISPTSLANFEASRASKPTAIAIPARQRKTRIDPSNVDYFA